VFVHEQLGGFMKGIIVYHSQWGSCRRIAEAIGRGLEDSGQDAQVFAVEAAPGPDPSLDFFVIGGWTRGGHALAKIKRYARKLDGRFSGKPFAAFSTGSEVFSEKRNRQASEELYDMLEEAGLTPLAPPFKGVIEGYTIFKRLIDHEARGHIAKGEEARAEDFGRELGAKLQSR
jgi:menaquinone-dependent protoporphyrinogen IX oxidase